MAAELGHKMLTWPESLFVQHMQLRLASQYSKVVCIIKWEAFKGAIGGYWITDEK